MANEIANELRLLHENGNPLTLEEYPIPAEDWELKQGEGMDMIGKWKAVYNYNTHDISIRYFDVRTDMVIAFNFKNIKDWDDTLYRIEYEPYAE